MSVVKDGVSAVRDAGLDDDFLPGLFTAYWPPFGPVAGVKCFSQANGSLPYAVGGGSFSSRRRWSEMVAAKIGHTRGFASLQPMTQTQ
jgi:hypothetical protein